MRVLLATDGSEDARAAATWLTLFPLPSGSDLRVVSAVGILGLDPRHPAGAGVPEVAHRRGAARGRGSSQPCSPRGSGPPRPDVVEGDARDRDRSRWPRSGPRPHRARGPWRRGRRGSPARHGVDRGRPPRALLGGRRQGRIDAAARGAGGGGRLQARAGGGSLLGPPAARRASPCACSALSSDPISPARSPRWPPGSSTSASRRS